MMPLVATGTLLGAETLEAMIYDECNPVLRRNSGAYSRVLINYAEWETYSCSNARIQRREDASRERARVAGHRGCPHPSRRFQRGPERRSCTGARRGALFACPDLGF